MNDATNTFTKLYRIVYFVYDMFVEKNDIFNTNNTENIKFTIL